MKLQLRLRLSPDSKKNPTQTKSLQNDYAVALRKLFRVYGMRAVDALEQSRYLEASSGSINVNWLADTLRSLGLSIIYYPGQKIVDDQVRKSYQAGTIYAGYGLKRMGIQVSVGPTTPADWRAMDVLKTRNLSALRGITDETSKQIIDELTTGIQRNEGIPELAKRISDRVQSVGITRATVFARTETINMFTQAAVQRYQQHGIEEAEWLTSEDERVCPICGPLDGQVFALDSNHEVPPIHPQCRCTILPVVSKD